MLVISNSFRKKIFNNEFNKDYGLRCPGACYCSCQCACDCPKPSTCDCNNSKISVFVDDIL